MRGIGGEYAVEGTLAVRAWSSTGVSGCQGGLRSWPKIKGPKGRDRARVSDEANHGNQQIYR